MPFVAPKDKQWELIIYRFKNQPYANELPFLLQPLSTLGTG
jgi:hypothetical protein